MRKTTILIAAAPLALLAACGDGADETAETADTMDTASTEATTGTDVTEADDPGTATTLADAGDYSGTYNFSSEDGETRSITLDSTDKSYSYTGEDGTEKTGTYSWASDGYRLSIPDYYGSDTYFAFRGDSFYRVPSDLEFDAETEVSGDRYRQSDAQFSRRPEIGSQVVPEDIQAED